MIRSRFVLATLAVMAVVGAWLAGRLVSGPGGLLLALTGAGVVLGTGSWWLHHRDRVLAVRLQGWQVGHDAPLPAGEVGSELGDTLDVLREGLRAQRTVPGRHELVEALTEPALLFSEAGRLRAANEAARRLLRIPVDVGDVTVVQAVGSAALAAAVRQTRERRRPVSLEVEHGERDLHATASLVGEEVLLIVEDRTRERRIEELRRDFVVNASHELKTPVTSLQTLAEALQVTIGRDPERSAALVQRLGDEADRLVQLVHDLLDLRRLEEPGPLERTSVDLAELVRRVVADLLPLAEEHDIEVEVEVPDRAELAGSVSDLEVIVKNLVGNALQYSDPGGRVLLTLSAEDGSRVLTVVDAGIGIPRSDLTRIFERFYRVDTARSRATGGTGLGLSIVRHAVERHGGTIRVDSLLGEGSTFTVRLPIEPRG